MSFTAELNTFLSNTRNMTADELNAMIVELDATAQPVTNANVAHAVLGYMQSAHLKGQTPSFAEAYARASSLQENQPYLFTAQPGDAATTQPADATTQPAAEVQKAPKQPKAPKAEKPARVKKSDQAAAIFASLEDKTKEHVMSVFVERLGISRLAAQTYYYACGGEKIGRRTRGDGEARTPVTKREGPSKAAQARELYLAAPDKSRSVMIALFMEKLGMSKAGATTYYYTAMSKVASVATTTPAPVAEQQGVQDNDQMQNEIATTSAE